MEDGPGANPRAWSKKAEIGDGPRGEEVVLLIASDSKGNQGNSIPHFRERVVENRQEYADWHGYTLHQVDFDDIDFPGHVIWKKIPAIKRAFTANPEAKWVWWLDLDAIIMNAHVPLSTYLLHPLVLETKLQRNATVRHMNATLSHADLRAEDVNLIFAADMNGLNAGSLFFKRGDWTDMLLDAWTDPYVMEHHQTMGKEQDALIHMINHYEEVANHTGLVDQHVINGYSVGDEHMKWQEDDIVVHFAGCWVDNSCDARFEKMWSMRSPVPQKYLKAPRIFP